MPKKANDTFNKRLLLKRYYLFFIGVFLILLSYFFNTQIQKKTSDVALVIEPIEKKITNVIQEPVELIEPLNVDSSFTTKSYVIYNVALGEIVGGKDVDLRLPNASTTKLMTALVAIKNFPIDKILPVNPECLGLEGNNVGFKIGETYYVEDLLYGLLLRSASDATCVFSSNFPGGTSAFIKELNLTAKELGLNNTNYINAIGLDADNHYSSSRDLLKLTLEVKNVEKLKIIMGSREFTLRDLTFRNNYYVANTNVLLYELPGTVGYKTGFTSSAGECLVFGYNNFGTELIIVVMGSENRFNDSKQLLELFLLKDSLNNQGTVEATFTQAPIIN